MTVPQAVRGKRLVGKRRQRGILGRRRRADAPGSVATSAGSDLDFLSVIAAARAWRPDLVGRRREHASPRQVHLMARRHVLLIATASVFRRRYNATHPARAIWPAKCALRCRLKKTARHACRPGPQRRTKPVAGRLTYTGTDAVDAAADHGEPRAAQRGSGQRVAKAPAGHQQQRRPRQHTLARTDAATKSVCVPAGTNDVGEAGIFRARAAVAVADTDQLRTVIEVQGSPGSPDRWSTRTAVTCARARQNGCRHRADAEWPGASTGLEPQRVEPCGGFRGSGLGSSHQHRRTEPSSLKDDRRTVGAEAGAQALVPSARHRLPSVHAARASAGKLPSAFATSPVRCSSPFGSSRA